jgi:hypothetical protein
MSSQLGPLEIDCDAPPYGIVAACHQIGLESPEDVRWCRISRHQHAPRNRREVFTNPWKWLFGSSRHATEVCACGQSLPDMEEFTFTLLSGKEMHYRMGQCRRCRTIFWDETGESQDCL